MEIKRNTVLRFVTTIVLFLILSLTAGASDSCPVEEYFTREGAHQVSTASYDSGVFGYGEYKAWYPSDMNTTDKKYPVIVYCNGSTVTDSIPYTVELLNHLVSHGYIVLSSDHPLSGNGDSASAELDFFLALDSQKNSLFYGKIDREKIGICGHSQGGSGAINAASQGKHSNSHMFKSLCAISTPFSSLAASVVQNTPYDASKVTVPTLLTGGTTPIETAICPLDKSLMENLNAVNNDTVVVARLTGADHLDTQDEAKGYITAWFNWTLLGDSFAATAFTGESPEIFRNGRWQDVVSKESLSKTDNNTGGFALPSLEEIGNFAQYIGTIVAEVIRQIIGRIKDIIL